MCNYAAWRPYISTGIQSVIYATSNQLPYSLTCLQYDFQGILFQTCQLLMAHGNEGRLLILLLLTCAATVQSQSVPTSNKSFSLCNSPEALPACAFDTPDRRVTPNPVFNPGICPEVLCAWECRRDLQCLEFNVHINRTCDLYYNQPMNYQSTTDCRHFQVSGARILRITSFPNL